MTRYSYGASHRDNEKLLGPFAVSISTPGALIDNEQAGILEFAGVLLIEIPAGTVVLGLWGAVTEAFDFSTDLSVQPSDGTQNVLMSLNVANPAASTAITQSLGHDSVGYQVRYLVDDGLYAALVYTPMEEPTTGSVDVYALLAVPQ